MPCAMAIKQYDEAFARLLHCASYGYQGGVRKGPFNKIGRFEELGQHKSARVLNGWMPKCACIAGYGTASQLSRFQVGRSCDFHRWKIIRSLLRRCGDWPSATSHWRREAHNPLGTCLLSLEWLGNGHTTPTRIRASVVHSGSAIFKCMLRRPSNAASTTNEYVNISWTYS